MQAETVSSARMQVLERLEAGPVVVTAGSMFDKNLWNAMQLEHINVTALSEAVTEMYKDGLLSMAEGTVQKTVVIGDGSDASVEAGIVRYGKRREQLRTYALTDRGRRELQRQLDRRNAMP
ncbi:MAG: hypothetical protein ACREGE_03360 [Candidatus Microsaccharimonas sp.]